MSELHIEIQELLNEGIAPREIATMLNIPIEWVTMIPFEPETELDA